MEGLSALQQIRCGHCNWLIASQCQDLLQHECFEGYDETVDVLNIDENSVATIVRRSEIQNADPLSLSQNFNTDFDENLIMAVIERPSLYNHKLDIKERSKLKKSALWEEIKNTLGVRLVGPPGLTLTGDKSIKDLQKRWKYHRDCYITARRKVKEYVPSGSEASSANSKCSYRFYELMRPLDDTLETKSTINTLSSEAERSPEGSSISSVSTQQNSQPSSATLNTENSRTNCSEIESSNISLKISTPSTRLTSETLTPTSTAIKKKKSHNRSSEIDAALLDVLKTPIPEMDAVDGYLKTLGEALRRLPFRERTIMEIRFLEMAVRAESQETE